MRVTVVIDADGLDNAEAAADRVRRRLTEDIANDARLGCAVDTGLLRSTIRTEHGAGASRVWVSTGYWSFVEYGTRPHLILPSAAKALHWPGARHPVRAVNHPGTPAKPFMRPALYRRRLP